MYILIIHSVANYQSYWFHIACSFCVGHRKMCLYIKILHAIFKIQLLEILNQRGSSKKRPNRISLSILKREKFIGNVRKVIMIILATNSEIALKVPSYTL